MKPVNLSWSIFDCLKSIRLPRITIILKYSCYRLSVFVCIPVPHLICRKLTPNVMIFGGEGFGDLGILGHKSVTLMKSISAFNKEISENSLVFFCCVKTQ